jgi:hypothetical protein
VGYCGCFFYQALVYEREWISTGTVVDQQDWDAAAGWTKLAMKFNPFNPNYPELLGRLHFWQFFIAGQSISSDEKAQAVANSGLVHLRHAIEMRPTWPLAWASLLKLKSIAGQIDYEFEPVWDKSVELGDWEPGVQTILLEAGLIHWPRFNDVLRKKTVNIFVAMTSKPFSERSAIRVVDRLNAWPLVCDVLVDPIVTPYAMRLACARMLKPRNRSWITKVCTSY